jgi:hypothetical protein
MQFNKLSKKSKKSNNINYMPLPWKIILIV